MQQDGSPGDRGQVRKGQSGRRRGRRREGSCRHRKVLVPRVRSGVMLGAAGGRGRSRDHFRGARGSGGSPASAQTRAAASWVLPSTRGWGRPGAPALGTDAGSALHCPGTPNLPQPRSNRTSRQQRTRAPLTRLSPASRFSSSLRPKPEPAGVEARGSLVWICVSPTTGGLTVSYWGFSYLRSLGRSRVFIFLRCLFALLAPEGLGAVPPLTLYGRVCEAFVLIIL